MSKHFRNAVSQVKQAGDYDLAHPFLLWIFGIGLSFSLSLGLILLKTKENKSLQVLGMVEVLLRKPYFFFIVLLSVVWSRLQETFNCFVWGYDSYHWVASDYIRPSFMRNFYGLFFESEKLIEEATLLQSYIGTGPICENFNMLTAVQAQQIFYFVSLIFFTIALRLYANSPLIALIVCILICSGSITGLPITLRNQVMIFSAGLLLGIQILKLSLEINGYKLLIVLLLTFPFLPSFVLFDSTAFPGQEVMSESLYLGLLNLFVGSFLLLSRRIKGHFSIDFFLLAGMLISVAILLSQTRLQGLAIFLLLILYLLYESMSQKSNRRTPYPLILVLTLILFISVQFNATKPKEPMTFWSTAAISLDFIRSDIDLSKFGSKEQAVIKNANERIKLVKKTNTEAGIPNDSQNLNSLYQGLLPAFEEVMGSSGATKNDIFRSITITSFKNNPFDWLGFIFRNLGSVFSFGVPTYLNYGFFTTALSPYSTVFFSPVLSLLFLFVLSYLLIQVRQKKVPWHFLVLPTIFLLEIIACSTFGVPLARYVRLTESYILVTVLFFFSSIHNSSNYISHRTKG